MDFLTELDFAKYIDGIGGKLYVVGGFVRDSFLKRISTDKDYVIVGVDINNLSFMDKVVGDKFPVFIVKIGDEKCEVALARKEHKEGIGHKGFTFFTNKFITIEDDLFRRDFTINAMAINVLTGEIIDPYNGKFDIQSKIIKHVSEAFKEDYLRIFRCARFATVLKFYIDNSLIDLIRSMVCNDEEIYSISKERIWKETEKSLLSDNLKRYFDILYELDLLKILMPEIEKYYKNNLANDIFSKLKNSPEDIAMRVTLLLHRCEIDEINNFCNRFKLSNDIKDKAVTFSSNFNSLKKLIEYDYYKIYKIINSIYRNYDFYVRAMFVLSIGSCDINVEVEKYKKKILLFRYYIMANSSITGNLLLNEGCELKGKEFGEYLLFNRMRKFKDLIIKDNVL
jgi:tRNA nucleotidyltransferase/poly(A) polymerase